MRRFGSLDGVATSATDLRGRPRQPHDEYPELFAELEKFYRLNPMDWTRA